MTHTELNTWQLAAIEGNTSATAKASIASAVAGQMAVEQLATLRAELSQDFAELNGAIRNIEEQHREIANLHKDGIELQQEVLRREDFQNRMEELIYQFQKLLKKMDDPKSDFPISTRYYLAVGIRETVRSQELSTVLIKGRDNKAAFEECIERASTIYKQLQNHAEVRKAIEWAASQEEKRREQEEKRREQEERERQIESLNTQIRKHEKSTQEPTFNAWLTRKFRPWAFFPQKAVLSVIASCISFLLCCLGVATLGARNLDASHYVMGALCLLPSVLCFVYFIVLGACYATFLSKKESIREELNRETYEEINQLKAKITRLRKPAGRPKPRELSPSNEVIPPAVELISVSLPKPPLTIQFTCPSCKKTLKAPADKAGVEISCPGCKASLQIPSR